MHTRFPMKLLNEQGKQRKRWETIILVLSVVTFLVIPYQFAIKHRVDFVGSVIIYLIDLLFLFNLFNKSRLRVGDKKGSFLIDLLAFDPGSMLACQGEYSTEIIFISKGRVDIVGDNEAKVDSLTDGEYFGELPLLLGEKRTHGARALSFCETFILSNDEFVRIKDSYPEFKELMKNISEKKTEQTSKLMMAGILI